MKFGVLCPAPTVQAEDKVVPSSDIRTKKSIFFHFVARTYQLLYYWKTELARVSHDSHNFNKFSCDLAAAAIWIELLGLPMRKVEL